MLIIILLAVLLAASLAAFHLVPSVRAWLKDSETILWARFQMLAGAIWTTLVQADLAPLLDPAWLTIWLIVSGAITEIGRRARAEDL